MRVVVTGATGNVGTSVLAALDEIVGVARRRPGFCLQRGGSHDFLYVDRP